MAETGRRVPQLNNARRVRCDECDLTSTPAGLGWRQKSTGHAGRVELS
jgi:hypothetical protein